MVTVNTTTNTETTTNTVTGVYEPNTNTNTNTATNTSTTTLTRFVTNTNTNTSTVTATSTNTNTTTATNTATKTYGSDADSDGFLQTSEIDPSGSDYLFIDEADNQTANFAQTIEQNVDLVYLQGDVSIGFGNSVDGGKTELGYMSPNTPYFIDQTIEQPVFEYTSFPGGAPANISVDDGFTDLGSNIQQISVDGDGWITITQDFVQVFDQDIVQDVFYEIDLVQTFIQTQDIVQTYEVDVLKSETRTRLVGE